MADALFDQGQIGATAQALMQRKRQLLAQEALAMGQQPPMEPVQPQLNTNQAQLQQNPIAPGMNQAQFSGYPAAQQRMTPQQAQQLARLLMARQSAQ